jgi:non-specific serine/threonine protein kinase/serine/threonine-protein kinase
MTPERWQQVKELFNAAMECETGLRAAFLDQSCAGDQELRAEVEALLAEEEKLGSFIAAPVAQAAPKLGQNDQEGRRIGPYRIVREIGHGGMGTVFLAVRDDDQFKKQVAIKLIRHGLNVDYIVSRFRYERQILASLDHPNIARLLDGGTTEDGLPYFVMEYIEGVPIDDYCDEQRLNNEARLKLFRKVCSAVRYAHQNLIVHRDIKPGNILITNDGEPKLLDFGIAKILDAEAFPGTVPATRTWERPMTPAYASPEQARGLPVTTSSDIYSLGVLLYEMLTGHRPYQVSEGGLPHEMARVICEQEPERPSTVVSRVEEITQSGRGETVRITPDSVSRLRDTPHARLRRQLKGDLDNIVLMALRKEPQRRYASVEHFSEDIQRYLDGHPVIARKDTFTYRSAKFIKRNKTGVAAAALVVASLLSGIVVSVRQARIAERRFDDLRQLTAYFLEFHDVIEDVPGATPARQVLLERTVGSLDRLAREASDDHSLRQDLASAYLKVGDVRGRPGYANLGNKTGALESYGKSLAIRDELLKADPDNVQARRDQAMTHDRVGDLLRIMGDTASALQHYHQALALRQSLAADAPTAGQKDMQPQLDLGTSYQRIGDLLAMTGKRTEAIENQRQAMAIFEQATAIKPDDKRIKRDLFIGYVKMGDRLAGAGDKTAALERYRSALQIAEALSAAEPDNARAKRELAVCHDKVGNILVATSDPAGALESYRQSFAIRKKLSLADPSNVEASRDLATSHVKIGETLVKMGRRAEALQPYFEALKIDEALSAADPNNAQPRLDRAYDHEQIGNLFAETGNISGAIEQHRLAESLRREISNADRENEEVRRDLAGSQARLGDLHAALAEKTGTALKRQIELWQEARKWYQQSDGIWAELRARHQLSAAESEDAKKVAASVAKCDQALARLRGW